MENAIEIFGLTKKYKDVVAVNDLSLKVKAGEPVALLGVNGAGKSTLVGILTGLVKADAGRATILGVDVAAQTTTVKSYIGISPQETAVAKNLSVRENLELVAAAYGFSREKRERRVNEIIADFSLGEVEKRFAGKLSGGWQRRLSIAMAIIGEPRVLFLDEPTLGLDVFARRELWRIIDGLKGKTTIVLTTHYLEEAESLADRIFVMRKGKIIADGTVEELISITNTDNFEDAFVKLEEDCL